jgi:hypothetical protein
MAAIKQLGHIKSCKFGNTAMTTTKLSIIVAAPQLGPFTEAQQCHLATLALKENIHV